MNVTSTSTPGWSHLIGNCSRGCLLALGLASLLAACGAPDPEQARICERLIPALERDGARYEIVAREAVADDPTAVRIVYVVEVGDARRRTGVTCRFAGAGLARERLRLEGVATDAGSLSPVEVFMLRRFWLDRYEEGTETTAGSGRFTGSLYALQLAVNGLALAAIYGVLAAGYTLIFALTRRINLAFGAMAVLGGYALFNGIFLLQTALIPLPLLLMPLLAVTFLFGATLGYAVERVVFRPLHRGSGQALLIASLGLAILLEEAIRLVHGASERWLQPLLTVRVEVASADGFAATATAAQLVCMVVAGLVFLGLALLGRTSIGRQLRAIAEDPLMAALCGARTGPLIATAFAISGALAALAGSLVLLRYGTIGASDGWLLGFKALTAAIVGGIGSIAGALVGALLIAGIETAWAGLFASAWREVVVFALLAATLVWRPEGLLGRPLPLGGR
jgi:branched-chain amino acid transport system permease protein